MKNDKQAFPTPAHSVGGGEYSEINPKVSVFG